jgi:2-polyprenyl-3-methyl-5-hydroxy-6-metoxy-1,4-benzoquinol methylase
MSIDVGRIEFPPRPDDQGGVTDQLTERTAPGLHESLLDKLPAGLRKDARILDVGCGTGAWLARLQRRGFSNLYGIDADVAQASSCKGATIARADLNDPQPWPVHGRFQLITAIEVIEHIENVGLFLDHVREHLEDDGCLLLTTPNIESLAARLRFLLLGELKQFDSIGDQTHIFPVLITTLNRILANRRLEIAARWGHPTDGHTVTSRWWVNTLARVLRGVLKENTPGDNLCLIIRKV